MRTSISTVTGMNSAPPFRPPPPEKRNDSRRNLYVLGLPFDLSKYVAFLLYVRWPSHLCRAELTSIFSCHGTVMHCVILATVDNASRRRGFVVMSTHAEARAAMDAISRTHVRFVRTIHLCVSKLSDREGAPSWTSLGPSCSALRVRSLRVRGSAPF